MPKNLSLRLPKFKINIRTAFRQHIAIVILLSLTIATRLLLIKDSPTIYHFDSYSYMNKAIAFAYDGTIQFSVGMPFVVSLASFIFALRLFLQPAWAVRILMLIMTAVTVCVVYLLGVKIGGKAFGFLAALIAMFESFFLTYSIVPHNDVFAVAMGLLALYFAVSGMRMGYVLAPIFLFSTTLTRPEFFPVFVIPTVAFFTAKAFQNTSKKSLAKLALIIGIYVLPAIWVYFTYGTYTRFGLFDKLNLFLTPSLVGFTFDSVFAFYDDILLSGIFILLVVIGIGLAVVTQFSRFFSLERTSGFSIKRRKDRSARQILGSEKTLVALCVFLVFIMDIIVLTAFGLGYTIVDGKVIVQTWFPDRYLILPRLLISYPLAYPLTIAVEGVRARIGRAK